MSKRHWHLLCLPLLGGCTISAVSELDRSGPVNSCDSESDCGREQKCSDNLCQALEGTLESLLITVTPPSDSAAPHLTFVTHLQDVPRAGGYFELPRLRSAKITGSVKLAPMDCYPEFLPDGSTMYLMSADLSLPVTVVLQPRESLLGLPQQLYVTSAHLQPEEGIYRYSLQVPPGSYDAYFTLPKATQCVVPPQLFRGEIIETDTLLEYTASVSSTLDLRVAWPKSNPPLTGWTIDIVEPLAGRTISNEVVLGTPVDPNPMSDTVPFDYGARLIYSTVSQRPGAEASPVPNATHDLVRLRPPKGLIAPAVFLDRTVFGLLNSKDAVLSAFTGYPAPVRLDARVQRADDGSPVASQVTLVSAQIEGMAGGILSSFTQTVSVGKDGRLLAEVPPGTYKIRAEPLLADFTAESSLAASEEIWTFSADVPVQAGKVLELKAGVGVTGDSEWEGASVQVRSTPLPSLQFDQAFGELLPQPRSSSALVEGNRFVVEVDPGVFDVSVRASEARGFGWWVRPGVVVRSGLEDLGSISLPLPTLLKATASAAVSNSAVLVGFASIGAYAYLDENFAYTNDPQQAASVVQVADTVANEKGEFQLLIPSELGGAN